MTRICLRHVRVCLQWLGVLLLAISVCLPAHAQAAVPLGADAPAFTLPLGAKAPAFTLPDTEGRARFLSEWAGRPVVLNFWAFWCDTWKAELPSLRELAADQPALGFALVAISVDGTRVPEFMRQRGAPTPFPALLDMQSRVSRAYGVAHVPTVIILDAEGRVRYTHIGYPGNDAVRSVLRRLAVPAAIAPPRRPRPVFPRRRAGARAHRLGSAEVSSLAGSSLHAAAMLHC